jgi:hypothetical protein
LLAGAGNAVGGAVADHVFGLADGTYLTTQVSALASAFMNLWKGRSLRDGFVWGRERPGGACDWQWRGSCRSPAAVAAARSHSTATQHDRPACHSS